MRQAGFLFLALVLSNSMAFAERTQLKVEGDAGVFFKASSIQEGYLESRVTKPGEEWFVLSGRGRFRTENLSRVGRFEIRDSYFQMRDQGLTARLGFQSLSWGETFGFFIADLVNPRDWSDPLLLDIEYVKKPVFMGQLHWVGEWWGRPTSAQIFFTPVTRHQEILPDWSAELQTRSPLGELGRDSEAGLRITHLFRGGLDASAFLISHLDRNRVIQPHRVLSSGLTGSQSFGDDWVIRSDQVWQFSQNQAAWQSVTGLHWTPAGDWNCGVQLQRDPGIWSSSFLLGYQGILNFFDVDLFGYRAIDRSDFWVQPKLTYRHPNGLSVSVRYDAVSELPGFSGNSRGLLWLSYRY